VQFTATEEYVRLVDQAKALLSHAVPRLTLEELQLRALRALVAELTKKKYATLDCSEQATSPGQRTEQAGSSDTGSSDTGSSDRYPARASLPEARAVQAGLREQPTASSTPRQRGRHIPAAVRRAVFERDGQHCSYVAATGKRCFETNRLEFHHLKPFAAGGEHAAANLTLRCAAHNALAAEEAFGRGHIEATRGLDS
jgi:5-methylcytosine-specific restriction endonuclease McrA